jgi:hypothetical protein
MTIDSVPSGIDVVVGGVVMSTPEVIDEATGFGYEISTPANVCIADVAYAFSSWSDGGARAHSITVGPSDESYVASYVATGGCGEPDCYTDADCDDGLFCNGTERCGPGGDCLPGIPIATADAIACTVDVCNEAIDTVMHSPDDTRCADSFYCNGAERCDATAGCVAGTPPSSDDGIACTIEVCDEASDSIVRTLDHQSCDDGNFCNGTEQCAAGLGCVAVNALGIDIDDGIACTTDFCNEASSTIVHTPIHSLCDDEKYCNGQEICDVTEGCRFGSPVFRDDGIGCTVDFCDDTSNVVVHRVDDSRCDDGLFCNGPESCDAVAGCRSGTPPCADGVGCTIDACDEQTDSCSYPLSDAACDDGDDCNGIESCDPSEGCRSGSIPDCGHLDSECAMGVCEGDNGVCRAQPTNEGLACEDGNACTMEDTCTAGVCAHISFCGVPASRGEIPVVSDALLALRAALALSDCPLCECDVNSDGRVTALDALAILTKAVELDVDLSCFVALGG